MAPLRSQRASAQRLLSLVFTAALSFTGACEVTDDPATDAGTGTSDKDGGEAGKAGSAGKAGASGKGGQGGKGGTTAGSGGKAGSGGTAGKDDSDAGTSDDDAGEPGLPQAFKITFSTTECFGFCPVYTVSLDQAGQVEFDGQNNVDKEGKSSKTVATSAAADVYEALVSAGYFELNDAYRDEADGCERVRTDGPTHNWSVERDGTTKPLAHYLGCEGVSALEKVRAVSDLLIEKAAIQEWIGDPN